MDIIHEIAEARHYFSYEDKEPNTVIIPESRRPELENMPMDWISPSQLSPDGKKFVFGCEIIYSEEADKIKIGYTV